MACRSTDVRRALVKHSDEPFVGLANLIHREVGHVVSFGCCLEVWKGRAIDAVSGNASEQRGRGPFGGRRSFGGSCFGKHRSHRKSDGLGTAGWNLYAFDAADGSTTCSGTPKICAPLWTATTGLVDDSPAVAGGVVYVGSNGLGGKLYAFDAAGNTGCSGASKTCAPLWTAATGNAVESSPAVANGVVYVGSDDHNLYAFDAAGAMNCSGAPKACAPLWTATTGGPVHSSPAVANGVIYVGSWDSKLHAFGLEKVPPTTYIAQPQNGATLSNTATVAAGASDDVNVSKVEFH